MDYKRVSLCGLSAIGKSSLLRKMETLGYAVIYTDFHENIERCSSFKDKHQNKLIQITYSEHVMSSKIIRPPKNGRILQDRFVFSDVIYETIYLQMKDKSGLEKLDSLLKIDFHRAQFEKYRVLFLLTEPSNFERVLQKMILRKNDIDILSLEYLHAQYEVFTHLQSYAISSFHFLYLKDCELYCELGTKRIIETLEEIFKN